MGQCLTREAAPQKCILRGDARVYTRHGAPRLADLAGREVEVATADHGWVLVRVGAVCSPLLRVALTDGGALHTGPSTAWPLAAGAARAATLAPGAVLAVGAAAPLGDAPARRAPRRGAFAGAARGVARHSARARSEHAAHDAGGARAAGGSLLDSAAGACDAGRAAAQSARVPEDALGLFGADAQAFLDGWADARSGFLIGTAAQVGALRALARRAGAARSFLSNGSGYSCLFADGVWAPAAGCARGWGRPLRGDSVHVLEVSAAARWRRAYGVELVHPGPAALVAVDCTAVLVECESADLLGLRDPFEPCEVPAEPAAGAAPSRMSSGGSYVAGGAGGAGDAGLYDSTA